MTRDLLPKSNSTKEDASHIPRQERMEIHKNTHGGKHPDNKRLFWSILAAYVPNLILPRSPSSVNLEANYSKCSRPIKAIIEVNKHTQAQSEISRAIITTPPPTPTAALLQLTDDVIVMHALELVAP